MNEELQSTNEELETINDELRERTDELNQVNAFLEAILTSLGSASPCWTPHQRVQVWNPRAEDLWGLRADEAFDKHFLSLDIGLPVRAARARRCAPSSAAPASARPASWRPSTGAGGRSSARPPCCR